MINPPTVWRCTGLHWESGIPVLTAAAGLADPSRERHAPPAGQHSEHRRTISLGFPIAWRLHGPRLCIGVWNGTFRAPCPHRATLDDGLDPQCNRCATADRGRAIARDAVVDDGRGYVLYLAWFGSRLIKVGLTATERDRDRLLEQGAIAYSLIATGPYAPIRRTERLISTAGLATERLSARAKADAWWTLPPAAERTQELNSVAQVITERLAWPDCVEPLPGKVVDQVAEFGLGQPPPATYAEVSGVSDGARLAGAIRLIVGRRLLLDTDGGPLLIDMRRIAGWALSTPETPSVADLQTVVRKSPRDHDADQEALF